MTKIPRTFHQARKAVRLILLAAFLALPFLKIGRESAFRFDVATLRLHVFGATIWMQDFFLVLIALFAVVFAAIFLTIKFGRLWCGWACPQTVLLDLTGILGKSGASRGAALPGYLAAVLLSAAVSAATIGYFVSPYDLGALFKTGGSSVGLVVGIWAVIAIVLLLDLTLLRRGFCAKVCPYAKLQGVLFDERTLVVAFDGNRSGECMKCSACVKACPMGVDIREGSQIECIHCAECVDACTEKMAKRSRPSLVNYSRGFIPLGGEAQGARGGVRVPLLISGVLTAAFLALLVFLFVSRPPFEATLHPVDPTNAVVTGNGAVAVRCVLTLRNMTDSALTLDLEPRSTVGTVLASRESFTLAAGAEPLESTVTLVIQGVVDPTKPIPVEVSIASSSPEYRVRESFTAIQRPRK